MLMLDAFSAFVLTLMLDAFSAFVLTLPGAFSTFVLTDLALAAAIMMVCNATTFSNHDKVCNLKNTISTIK